MASPSLDAIIMTYNEEKNLDYCLQSIQGLARNIFIVDSGSTDRTLEIASRYRAQIFIHEFTTQAEQFNWALGHVPIQSEWVLRLDADEYLLPELQKEITETLPRLPPEVTGLYMKRRMIFLGRWIRHGGYYPIWILRLFHYGKGRYEKVDINEHIVLSEGKSAKLKHDFVDCDHDGLTAWILKHEGFATRQARFLSRLQEEGYDSFWIKNKLLGSQAERKRWLLYYFYGRLPFLLRAPLYFVYRYFFRAGFLDGIPGLIFHFLQGCWYPFYTDAKIYEARLKHESSARHAIGSSTLRRG